MERNNVDIAVAYYTAMAEKNVEGAEIYLHPNVEFIGPLSTMRGKEAVLDAAKKWTDAFKALNIRAKFDGGDQAMLIIDLIDFFNLPDIFRSATCVTVQNNLITKIELFYDARPFEKKKDEIFS